MSTDALDSADILLPEELKIAKVLLHNKKITKDQFMAYLKERDRFEKEGKRPLGDILVEKGLIKREVLSEFLKEHNDFYREFCKQLVEEGFLRQEQLEKILKHEDSSTNIVSSIDKLNIMTKTNFIILYSKRVNSLRLGDWLLHGKKITLDQLKLCLAEQRVYRLDDYFIYHKVVTREIMEKIKDKLELM